MNAEVQNLINSLEQDIDRIRGLDPALKSSMLTRLEALLRMML